jgi:hypothetical protein
MALTYDAADGYLLLFGSVGGTGASNGTQTWAYAGGNWTELHPANSPVSCPSSALAYDSVDHYVVYLGGGGWAGGNCSSSGQTWSFTAGTWTQLHPATAPPILAAASFTNDSHDGYDLLFGGLFDANNTPSSETWSFVAGSWTELSPATSPAARSSAGLTYDGADGYVLLFGGTEANRVVNDTWTYAGGDWTQLHPTSNPIAPWPDGLAYDASDGVVVYTSAENLSYPGPEQVWTFSAGSWTEWLANQGHHGIVPTERLAEVTGYDWGDGYFVLFGGSAYGWQPLHDLWAFHDGNWTNITAPAPSPREGAAGVYDGADGYFLLFGGFNGSTYNNYVSDSWKWAGGSWTHLTTNASPPARAYAGLTYDAADGYVLLFGGSGSGGLLDDTWEFTDGGWTEITPSLSPPPAAAYQDLVYDAADGYALLVDVAATTTTWAYHAGVWQNLTAESSSIPAAPTNGVVYDAAAARVLVFGTETTIGNGAYASNATWTYLNGTWSNLTAAVGPAPSPRWDAAMTYDATQRGVLLFGGVASGRGGYTNDTWLFSSGHWALLYTPVVPPGRNFATLAYDPTSNVDLLFGGAVYSSTLPPDGCTTYFCGDTWAWSGVGVSTPYVELFAAAPNPIDLGATTALSVEVYGGVTPYSYVYTGLPSGCTTANTSQLNCTPVSVGNFSVTVHITDAAHNGTSASAAVEVLPDLALVSFNASPSTIPVGGRTLFSVQVANGVAPYGYTYAGLPVGCTSQTVPTLPCSPEASGTFDVSVTVTDHDGHQVSGSISLTVPPAGSGSGPTILSFGIAPAAVPLGNSTNFFVNASGGTGALTIAYTGLPPGCTSADQSPLTCAPTASGVFAVQFTVVDGAGASVEVESNLTVFPVGGGGSALITSFSASPGTVVQGHSTVVTVTASGGTSPLTFSYPALPPGCPSSDTASLPCTPSASGTFVVEVRVTDARGNTTVAHATLTVVPAVTTPKGPLGVSGSGIPIAYVEWIVGGVVGLLAAVACTDRILVRRRVRQEGEALVRAMNDAADPRPPVSPPP